MVYVDDISLAGDNGQVIADLEAFLDQQFRIKDRSSVHYFLGLEVSLVEGGYVVHQHKYTTDLLSEFHCLDAKPVTTPLVPQNKLHIDSSDPISDPSTYRRLIGKLNFLQHTKPDISFFVQHLSEFLGILLSSSSDFTLKAYSDSDWAACPISRRSVTGYFILLGDSHVSWKSKKHPTVSLSSAEAEYRELKHVVAEVSWLLRLLANVGLSITSLVSVFCDSQVAVHITRNSVFHERTKHIEVDCHYVGDVLSSGVISLHHVHTYAQLADMLTKALTGVPHHKLLCKLGFHSPSSFRGVGVGW
uniref:Uncharacterized mitochondrial protein AtMg00810-like n=1 Tax=Nicotiana tabacum TaxID=4097 RepID=A0A1S4DRB3_TOBAC|nr:PREDICTED: uncharacterized mitochondrial protein AtMg00810-like [Nicotiana tabacum]